MDLNAHPLQISIEAFPTETSLFFTLFRTFHRILLILTGLTAMTAALPIFFIIRTVHGVDYTLVFCYASVVSFPIPPLFTEAALFAIERTLEALFAQVFATITTVCAAFVVFFIFWTLRFGTTFALFNAFAAHIPFEAFFAETSLFALIGTVL